MQGEKSALLLADKKSLSAVYFLLSTEKGLALVMVLVLSAILLALMAGLIYMVTAGARMSGYQKRYRTAVEAGKGGADIVYQLIGRRGDPVPTASFSDDLNDAALNPVFAVTDACKGTSGAGDPYTGLAAKLNTSSSTWSEGCDKTFTAGPSSFDMRLDLGVGNTYRVYAKIVDTVEGNSGPDEGLTSKGVVSANSGEVAVKSIPFLYTLELESESAANPSERAKLSVLYLY